MAVFTQRCDGVHPASQQRDDRQFVSAAKWFQRLHTVHRVQRQLLRGQHRVNLQLLDRHDVKMLPGILLELLDKLRQIVCPQRHARRLIVSAIAGEQIPDHRDIGQILHGCLLKADKAV